MNGHVGSAITKGLCRLTSADQHVEVGKLTRRSGGDHEQRQKRAPQAAQALVRRHRAEQLWSVGSGEGEVSGLLPCNSTRPPSFVF